MAAAIPETGVVTIDCQYVYPRAAAAFLVIEGDRAAFVENNTSHAVPLLLRALHEHGLAPENVDYAVITHVHLDHAGGTSALLNRCPNATVLAHPKAARHVIEPGRLVESSKQVYGDEVFAKLYGEIHPVPEERVRVMEDGEVLSFGDRKLTFVFTRGHADHHFCIHDDRSSGVFTGDSFGIGYADLQSGGPFLYPSTTPTQFHPEEARRSVRKIRDTGAERAYLTHFGEFADMDAGEEQMLAGLDAFEALLHRAVESDASGDDLQRFCEDGVRQYFHAKVESAGRVDAFGGDAWKLMNLDIGINAMGIAFAAERIRRKSA